MIANHEVAGAERPDDLPTGTTVSKARPSAVISQAKKPLRRILFVSHVGTLGGAELSLLDLLESLDRRRYASRVVLPGPGELSERLDATGIPVDFCAPLQRFHRSKRPSQLCRQAGLLARGALRLRRLVQRHRPELIHANSTTGALYLLCLPWNLRPPVIWHVRDMTQPGHIERLLGRRSARIVVPSLACRAIVERVADPAKIQFVPNGIRIEIRGGVLAPVSLRRELDVGDGPLAVVIGQLVPWKGHDLALEAARLVHARDPSVRFLLIGGDRFGDHPDLSGDLQRRIEQMGLAGSVRLLGHRTDAREILGCADLLVHPAFPEPFGRVVVEAMAAVRPVVAFAGEHGPAEIIRDGVDGLLVSPRTAEALAEAIVSLVERPEVLKRMGAEGRRRAEKLYDRSLTAPRIEALYDSILADDATRIKEAAA